MRAALATAVLLPFLPLSGCIAEFETPHVTVSLRIEGNEVFSLPTILDGGLSYNGVYYGNSHGSFLLNVSFEGSHEVMLHDVRLNVSAGEHYLPVEFSNAQEVDGVIQLGHVDPTEPGRSSWRVIDPGLLELPRGAPVAVRLEGYWTGWSADGRLLDRETFRVESATSVLPSMPDAPFRWASGPQLSGNGIATGFSGRITIDEPLTRVSHVYAYATAWNRDPRDERTVYIYEDARLLRDGTAQSSLAAGDTVEVMSVEEGGEEFAQSGVCMPISTFEPGPAVFVLVVEYEDPSGSSLKASLPALVT